MRRKHSSEKNVPTFLSFCFIQRCINVHNNQMQHLNERGSRGQPPELRTDHDQFVKISVVASPRSPTHHHASKPRKPLAAMALTYITRIATDHHLRQRWTPALLLFVCGCAATLWLLWTLIFPIRIYGFLPFPSGYPSANLRYVFLHSSSTHPPTNNDQQTNKQSPYYPTDERGYEYDFNTNSIEKYAEQRHFQDTALPPTPPPSSPLLSPCLSPPPLPPPPLQHHHLYMKEGRA